MPLAYFDEAERLGSTIGDNLLVAHARISRGYAANTLNGYAANAQQRTHGFGLSDVTSGVDLLDQIVETAVEPPPIYVRDWSHPNTHRAFRAMIRAVVGDLDAALDDIAEYVPGAPNENVDRRVDIRPTTTIAATEQMGSARAYLAFGRVRAMQGLPAESAQAFEQALLLTAQTNDDGMLALSYMNWLAYLTLPYFADDMELRRNMLERHDQAWSRAVDKLGIRPMPEGVSHLLTAYLDGAWSEMDWMDGWWHEQMATSTLSWGIVEEVVFARRAHARGEFERAWREIRHVLPQGPTTEPGDCVFRGAEDLQRLAVELALDERNLPEARGWLEAHDRWLDWSGAFTGRAEGIMLWAHYHQRANDSSRARRLADQALALASDPRQPLALTAIHRLLGKLNTEAKQFNDADSHLQESLRLAEACAAPFERALTLVELAELRVAQRRPDAAMFLLNDVQSICEPLQAKPTLERVDALRHRISKMSQRAPSYPAGLSPREVEVLQLVAGGLTDAEIADKLFLSRRTVSAHLRSVYNKIGIGSRAAAAVWAKEHRLI